MHNHNALGNWERAFYMLPAIGDPATLGIKTMDISVTPEEKIGAKWEQISGLKTQTAGFNNNRRKRYGPTVIARKSCVLNFRSRQFMLKGFNRDNFRFRITNTITPKQQSMETETYAHCLMVTCQ
jgi:hypothetical protein